MARRLEDLYVRGSAFEVDDGSGDPVPVWIQKPDPVEHDSILLAANGVQAITMSSAKTMDGEWLGAFAETVLLESDRLIEELFFLKQAEQQPVAAHRVSLEDEWRDDSYLEGLQQAWASDLEVRLGQNPEDVDAKRVKSELDKYEAQVQEDLAAEMAPFRRDLEQQSLEYLQDEVTRQRLKIRSLMRWHNEYREQTLFYAVRDPEDRARRYFDSIDATRRLASPVKEALMGEYNRIIVETVEGKESPGAAGSLDSSVPAAPEGTSDSSGQQIAAA